MKNGLLEGGQIVSGLFLTKLAESFRWGMNARKSKTPYYF